MYVHKSCTVLYVKIIGACIYFQLSKYKENLDILVCVRFDYVNTAAREPSPAGAKSLPRLCVLLICYSFMKPKYRTYLSL